jgi:threonine dehydrogenase-like Zn-dependent dehydrogenase
LLRGMLAGAGVPLERARIALLGAGNIGRYLLARLRDSGVARIVALEPSAETRAWLAEQGVEAWPVERKLELLAQPLDAIVVNASGGSLDAAAVKAIAANGAVRVVCGSENLAMPNASDERVLLAAGKVYCHPELGGMMGYLTAVEEYLTRREEKPFDVDVLLGAAKRLHDVGYEATVRVVAGRYRETFQQAVRAIYDG